MQKSNATFLRSAKELFAAERDTSIRALIVANKAATIAKMGKLRALRLARDAEQEASDNVSPEAAPSKPARRKPKSVAPRE
jgi:hypothetical protein